jgi:BlaI family penicillinase repressor
MPEAAMAEARIPDGLGRRERQIMDVLHRLGSASVAQVREALPDPPTYSSVRGMLNLLKDKGHVTHEAQGLRYIYRPSINGASARRSALEHVVQTFFGGSALEAAANLLESPESGLAPEDVARLTEIIRQARSEGR